MSRFYSLFHQINSEFTIRGIKINNNRDPEELLGRVGSILAQVGENKSHIRIVNFKKAPLAMRNVPLRLSVILCTTVNSVALRFLVAALQLPRSLYRSISVAENRRESRRELPKGLSAVSGVTDAGTRPRVLSSVSGNEKCAGSLRAADFRSEPQVHSEEIRAVCGLGQENLSPLETKISLGVKSDS